MTENIIFKKLLIDSNYFSNVFGNLKPTDFENDYVYLYNGIQTLYSKYNKSPNLNEINLYFDSLNLTTQQKLRINEKIDELKHLEIDIKDDMLVDFTEKWVKNKRTNDLLLLGADFLDGKNKESLESIQVKMEEINKLTFKKSSGLDYKKDAAKNFLEYSTQTENGITPSLEIMRIATNGGYLPGHLIIYASVSNGGKTVFLVNGACDVLLQGKNVAYFTFEEMEIDIRERFDARLMNIQTNQFQKLGSSLISNFTSLLSKGLGELKIKAYGPRSASVLTVKSQLEEWKLKENFIPDMVVLDSIGIMAPSSKSDSLYMNGKNVSEEAKALGVELQVPILSAVQFGRSSFGSCLDLATKVETENGDKIEINKLKVGDKILSHNGYREVKHIFPIKKKKRFIIKTKSGKEIICSEEHLFPSDKGELSLKLGLKVGNKLWVK